MSEKSTHNHIFEGKIRDYEKELIEFYNENYAYNEFNKVDFKGRWRTAPGVGVVTTKLNRWVVGDVVGFGASQSHRVDLERARQIVDV